jgi:predicted MPP superfamily phosphohydrolase
MRVNFENVLYNAGVDLVLAGHVHGPSLHCSCTVGFNIFIIYIAAYERFYRVHNNAKNSAGPYYITIG